MNTPAIRRATPADIPRLRRIGAQASTAAHWSEPQYQALFAAEGPKRFALVATRESGSESVVAFLISRCLDDEWELENIVVDEPERHFGVGSALVRRLVTEAAASGARSIILEVRESNGQAVRLYERIGFMCEGRRKGYYGNPTEDAVLYRLTLQTCDKIP